MIFYPANIKKLFLQKKLTTAIVPRTVSGSGIVHLAAERETRASSRETGKNTKNKGKKVKNKFMFLSLQSGKAIKMTKENNTEQ